MKNIISKRIQSIFFIPSLIFVFFFSLSYSNQIDNRITKNSNLGLSGEKYITGDDGIARIAVNLWGHVKNPGTYLIYDEVDILTCLSIAGGPLKGANFKEIVIISSDGSRNVVNLDRIISDKDLFSIKIKPNDTIVVEERLSSYIISRSNVINTILQVLNLFLFISNNN